MDTVARGVYGAFFSASEVQTMHRRWLAAPADALDAPVPYAASRFCDDDEEAGDWFIGQAHAAGLEAGCGTWCADDGPDDVYFAHLPGAPQLEGDAGALAGLVAALTAVDATPLQQFCAEVLRAPAPAPEYRALKVLE